MSPRQVISCALIGVLFSILSAAADEPRPATQPARSAAEAVATSQPARPLTPKPADAAAILALPIEHVRFEDAPLRDVCNWVAEMAGVSAFVNWRAMERVGIARSDPFTADLRNITLGEFLGLLTQYTSEPGAELSFTIRDNLIYVTTRDELALELVTRVYAVERAVFGSAREGRVKLGHPPSYAYRSPLPPTGGPAAAPPPIFEQEGRLKGLAPIGVEYSRWFAEDPAILAERQLNELAHIITQTVAPHSWAIHGGAGSIRAYNGYLIVANSPMVHQQLQGLLGDESD